MELKSISLTGSLNQDIHNAKIFLMNECKQYLNSFVSGGDRTSFDTVFKGWHEYQREYFLKNLSFEKTAGELGDKQ